MKRIPRWVVVVSVISALFLVVGRPLEVLFVRYPGVLHAIHPNLLWCRPYVWIPAEERDLGIGLGLRGFGSVQGEHVMMRTDERLIALIETSNSMFQTPGPAFCLEPHQGINPGMLSRMDGQAVPEPEVTFRFDRQISPGAGGATGEPDELSTLRLTLMDREVRSIADAAVKVRGRFPHSWSEMLAYVQLVPATYKPGTEINPTADEPAIWVAVDKRGEVMRVIAKPPNGVPTTTYYQCVTDRSAGTARLQAIVPDKSTLGRGYETILATTLPTEPRTFADVEPPSP